MLLGPIVGVSARAENPRCACAEGKIIASEMNSNPPSYEDILKPHKLTSAELDVRCPEEFLHYISRQANYARWRTVILGVDRSDVDSIDKDQNKEDEEKCLKLLLYWKERFGPGATYERLARSFIDSRRADKVCEEFLKRKPEGECTVLLFLVWRYQIWLKFL